MKNGRQMDLLGQRQLLLQNASLPRPPLSICDPVVVQPDFSYGHDLSPVSEITPFRGRCESRVLGFGRMYADRSKDIRERVGQLNNPERRGIIERGDHNPADACARRAVQNGLAVGSKNFQIQVAMAIDQSWQRR